MTPGIYLAKAERALSSAKLLLLNGDIEGACNRAYYTAFDAAKAALATSEGGSFNPGDTKTHSGLIRAFGLKLIKTGKVGAESGRTLNQIEQLRLLADYTGDEITQDRAEWAIAQAERFLRDIGTYIKTMD